MEGIQFDKKVLRFMTPLEGMVTSTTLELKNEGAKPVVFKFVRSMDKNHFLVEPKMGRIEAGGGVTKIIVLFRGGLIRRKSSIRVDFAQLSSYKSSMLTAAEFWDTENLSNLVSDGNDFDTDIAISRASFKINIEIEKFNIENGLFETQLFTSGNAINEIGMNSSNTEDVSTIGHLARRASIIDEGNGKLSERSDKQADNTEIRKGSRDVKGSWSGMNRGIGSGNDSVRLGRLGTFWRGSAGKVPLGGGERDRPQMRRLKRLFGYGGLGSTRSFRLAKKVDQERQVQSTRSPGNVMQADEDSLSEQKDEYVDVARMRSHNNPRKGYRQGRMHYKSSQINIHPANLCAEPKPPDMGREQLFGNPIKQQIYSVGRNTLLFNSIGASEDGIRLENHSNSTKTYRVRTTDAAFLADPSVGILRPNSTTVIRCSYTGRPFSKEPSSQNFFQVEVANSKTQATSQLNAKVSKLLFEVRFHISDSEQSSMIDSTYEGAEGNVSVPKRARSNTKQEEEEISPSSDDSSAETTGFVPYTEVRYPPKNREGLAISSVPHKTDDLVPIIASSKEPSGIPSQTSSTLPSSPT